MNRFTKVIFDKKLVEKIEETSCRGSVLVEFAVWMPLLIILLSYIYDLVKIKRYYSQTEFIGQQIVNIIQNISGGVNVPVTKDNLKHALCLANLSLLPGTTMYTQDKDYPGYTTLVQVYRVVGDGTGNAKCTSRIELSAWKGNKPPKDIFYNCTSEDHEGSKVRYSSTAVSPSEIYPTLTMGSGSNIAEEKIVIDVCLLTDSTKSTEKQILGLYQAMPPFLTDDEDKFHFYFHSVTIFTPEKGLFSDSCPPTLSSES